MNLMAAYAKTDLSNHSLMASFSNRVSTEQHRKTLWKAKGIAYALALLAHYALWQLYQAMPTVPPEEPPVIEASLVVSKSAPAPVAVAPTLAPPQIQPPPPKPKIQPKPQPKPLPKPEKPAIKKPDRPKLIPKPQPQAEAEPAPAPPTPAVEEAPPAPPIAAHPAPKAEARQDDSGEDRQYHPGAISGFSRRYPRLAQERGWEGTVRLKVHISADGEIGEVTVISSSGYEVLDEQAVELIKEARATPARRGDKAVDSTVIVPYQFKLPKS